MRQQIRRLLFGDENIKEYAAVSSNNIQREIVLLQVNNININVTEKHYLFCLEPIIFGIWIETPSVIFNEVNVKYTMAVIDATSENTIAQLTLSYFNYIKNENGFLLLLKVDNSKINHLNFFTTRFLFNRFYSKPKFSYKKFKELAAAYSYPKRVRIISFKEGNYYNIFPMDLLGDIKSITGNYYAFGLRHTNNALLKIIESRKLVVCEVGFEHKALIYTLGSHHSINPPPIESLPFKVFNSQSFGFFVPEWVESYKEVEIKTTINLGSHMLLWGEVKNKQAVSALTGGLSHIHYLLYLYHKKKGNNYLLAP